MNSWTQIRQTSSAQNVHAPFSVINPQHSLRLSSGFITRKLTNTGTGRKRQQEKNLQKPAKAEKTSTPTYCLSQGCSPNTII